MGILTGPRTRTVAVYATVQDERGSLVPDLSRDDFQVFEDGAPRDIVQFSSDPQPLNVVVMLQTGSGMLSAPVPLARRLQVRDACTRTLFQLMIFWFSQRLKRKSGTESIPKPLIVVKLRI